MVTMLDCIRRSEKIGHIILDKAKENTEGLKQITDLTKIDEIVVIGSGSSFNATLCEESFLEKVSGLRVTAYLPNNFEKRHFINRNALYLFVSQSGTSSLVKQQIIKVKGLGCKTVAITDDSDSPIAKEADLNISIEVGGEKYGYRTVGFCATLLTLQVIGLRIGLERGAISEEAFDGYIAEGRKALAHHPEVIEDTLKWFEANKDDLKPLRSLMYYGGGELYGVAVEGALKLMETPKKYLAFGYEAEDGIHGPCYAFGKGDAILFLNDGVSDKQYALNMARFSKEELGLGFVFGPETIDERDLRIVPVSENFKALEFIPSVQIIAYEMALLNGVDVLPMSIRIPHVSTKYFQTHNG